MLSHFAVDPRGHHQIGLLVTGYHADVGRRLSAGTDAVVVARRDAKGLAEREGLAGIRRVLGELLTRASVGGGDREPAS